MELNNEKQTKEEMMKKLFEEYKEWKKKREKEKEKKE